MPCTSALILSIVLNWILTPGFEITPRKPGLEGTHIIITLLLRKGDVLIANQKSGTRRLR